MTADEHLQVIVGQLIIQVAMLKAEIDHLKADLDTVARLNHERLKVENERP